MLVAVATAAGAQPGSVEGRVRDGNGRPIAAASIALLGADSSLLRTSSTDRLGQFRIAALSAGRYTLRVQHIGYADLTQAVEVGPGRSTAVELVVTERAVRLPGVGVEVDRARDTFESSAGATTRTITRAELSNLPGLAEADVLRAIEILPGVVSTSDYTSAFNVRGGSADQNLILLDGIPIYNPFHLGGVFSVFNADMVGRAELLAGGFPAEWGGRVASVLQIESDPGLGPLDVQGGISLLATRASVGAPLPDAAGLENGRLRLSLRRSYFDALFRPFFDFPYHLTDAQLYAEAWTRGGARLSVTGYSGRDVLNLARSDSFPLRLRWGWGNDLAGARLTAPLARGGALDVRSGFTRFDTDIRFPDFADTRLRARIGHFLVRADADLRPVGGLAVRVGAEANRKRYDNLAQSGGTTFGEGRDAGWLTGAWAHAAWRASPRWLVEAGARVDHWAPGRSAAVTEPAPRAAVKHFFAGGDAAVKLAGGRYTQFVHSLRDEELPLGIDIWVLSGARAPHVVSDQAQAGVEAFLPHGWYAAVEAYYRWFDGVVTNNFAADPNDDTDDIIGGTGISYGADLLVRRDRGRLRPALAVSWLRATRDFADPTQGSEPAPLVRYPPVFDRRLDIDLVVGALLGRGVEGGLRWSYGTGLPYTRPRAAYRTYTYEIVNGGVRSPSRSDDGSSIVLGPRNAERYPPYHRLDLSLRRTWDRRWGRLTPYVDVLNVYNRKNVLFYYYRLERTPAQRAGISMFPLLPTFGLEVTF
jgi:hypothetical protein